jgi:hypothetical protein
MYKLTVTFDSIVYCDPSFPSKVATWIFRGGAILLREGANDLKWSKWALVHDFYGHFMIYGASNVCYWRVKITKCKRLTIIISLEGKMTNYSTWWEWLFPSSIKLNPLIYSNLRPSTIRKHLRAFVYVWNVTFTVGNGMFHCSCDVL